MGEALRVLGIVPVTEAAFGWLLTREGFEVRIEQTPHGGLTQFQAWKPNAVVLDWDLLGAEATRVCAELAAETEFGDGAVIGVAGSGDAGAIFDALRAGALDFLRKPLDALELFCRIKSHLGHLEARKEDTVRVGNLTLDTRNHLAKEAGRVIPLTPSECSIFRFLLAEPGRAVGVETLLVEALGYPARLGNPEIVRTHVRNLRQKIELDAARPRRIVNIPRVGYVYRS